MAAGATARRAGSTRRSPTMARCADRSSTARPQRSSAIALVLTLIGWSDDAVEAARLAGARARARAGVHGAAADLVLRAPDPRPVARRLDVPEGARGLQQDVRRRAPPRHARRRRRVLLARPDRLRGRLVPQRLAPLDRGRGREDRLDHRRRKHSCRHHRRRLPERDRGPPRGAVADRDPLRGLRASCCGWADRRPGAQGHRRSRPQAGVARRPRPEPRARAGRLAVGDHDHRGPVPRAHAATPPRGSRFSCSSRSCSAPSS